MEKVTFEGMPSFRDPDGSVWVWDAESKTMVKKPAGTEGYPDRGHATGGDNDLFDPFVHTEESSVPELEGYMAGVKTSIPDRPGQDDLTPGMSPEQLEAYYQEKAVGHPWTPQVLQGGGQNTYNVGDQVTGAPGSQRENMRGYVVDHEPDAPYGEYGVQWYPTDSDVEYRDSHELLPHGSGRPDLKLAYFGEPSKQENFNDLVSACAGYMGIARDDPRYAELYNKILDLSGGNIPKSGRGYMVADNIIVELLEAPFQWWRERKWKQYIPQVVEQLTQADPSLAQAQQAQQIPALDARQDMNEDISNTLYNGVQPVPTIPQARRQGAATELIPKNTDHWSPADQVNCPNCSTATKDEVCPTCGKDLTPEWNSKQHNEFQDVHAPFDPRNEFISDPERVPKRNREKTDDSYPSMNLSHIAPVSRVKPLFFSSFAEELAWREANGPNLEECPECHDTMHDDGDKKVCHGCGHSQKIIEAKTAAPLIPEALGLLGGGLADAGAVGAADAGAAGLAGGEAGGIPGVGQLMNKALQGGAFRQGEDMVGGGGGAPGAAAGAPAGPLQPGIISSTSLKEAGLLGDIVEFLSGKLKAAPEAFTDPSNPLSYIDDVAGLAGGAAGAAHNQQSFSNIVAAFHESKGAFGEEEVGTATKNRGENSDPDDASSTGIEGEKEHGDSPEQLKDVDGIGGPTDPDEAGPLSDQGDPELQDKALKAFHMNKPLILELAGSDEAGSENPILLAIDALLEEAFPGYRDEGKGTSEHPLEEDGGDDSGSDEASDDSKKSPESDSEPKESSVRDWELHTSGPRWDNFKDTVSDGASALGSGLADTADAFGGMGAALRDTTRDTLGLWPTCPECQQGKMQPSGRGQHTCLNCGHESMPIDHPDHALGRGGVWGDQYHEYQPRPEAERYATKTGSAVNSLWAFASDEGDKCEKCGHEHDGKCPEIANKTAGSDKHEEQFNPFKESDEEEERQIRAEQAEEDARRRKEKEAGMQPMQQNQFGTPAMAPGSGAPGIAGANPTCPNCGQSHLQGTPCPTDTAQNIPQPMANGAPISPQPAPNVVTTKTSKWEIISFGEVVQPPTAAGTCPRCQHNLDFDANGGTYCPQCGWTSAGGAAAPQQPQAPPTDLFDPQNQGAGYSMRAAVEPEVLAQMVGGASVPGDDFGFYGPVTATHHESWVDADGAPIQAGHDYDLVSHDYAIPDKITVNEVFPDKLTYTIHASSSDPSSLPYQSELTKTELETMGYKFIASEEVSPDSDDGGEHPIRPGQDAIPQTDDLSTPSTVVSNVGDTVSLDNYTGSYQGDAPDDRSWILHGGSSDGVAVDPALMSKFAGKDFDGQEQRAFIDEPGEARNLGDLDLEGTHYLDHDVDEAFAFGW